MKLHIICSIISRIKRIQCSTDSVIELVKRCSLLNHLFIENRLDAATILSAVAQNCPRLCQLHVRFCRDEISAELLEQLSVNCPQLTLLDFEGADLLNKDIKHEIEDSNECNCQHGQSFAFAFANLKMLTHLNLSECRNLKDQGRIESKNRGDRGRGTLLGNPGLERGPRGSRRGRRRRHRRPVRMTPSLRRRDAAAAPRREENVP